MAPSAVVQDYRALEIGRRRANRLALTISEWGTCRRQTHLALRSRCGRCWSEKQPAGRSRPRSTTVDEREQRRADDHDASGLCAPGPAAIPIAPLQRNGCRRAQKRIRRSLEVQVAI